MGDRSRRVHGDDHGDDERHSDGSSSSDEEVGQLNLPHNHVVLVRIYVSASKITTNIRSIRYIHCKYLYMQYCSTIQVAE